MIGSTTARPALEATGYVYMGDVGEEDINAPRTLRPLATSKHTLVHQDAVPLVKVSKDEGWTQDYFCEPLNKSHGVGTCWMYGYFGPKTVHHEAPPRQLRGDLFRAEGPRSRRSG